MTSQELTFDVAEPEEEIASDFGDRRIEFTSELPERFLHRSLADLPPPSPCLEVLHGAVQRDDTFPFQRGFKNMSQGVAAKVS
jgi:hypothetical protein